MNPIDIDDLHKHFGRTRALNGLTMSVEAGTAHGFLGPNGSGKTTTLRILVGLARADSGSVRVFGTDPWDHVKAVYRRFAYVPGEIELWPSLTGGEIIDFLGRLRGGVHHGRRAELLERFDLDPTRKIRTSSKGNRQKVILISALAAEVDLLLLDEPTAGLDPLMESVFRECIEERCAAGTTVLLSTHRLDEVEEVCTSVSIIGSGRTIDSGRLDDLRQLTGVAVTARLIGSAGSLFDRPAFRNCEIDGARLSGSVDRGELDEVLRILAFIGVEDVTITPSTLEDLFRRRYSTSLQGTAAGVGARS